MVTDLIHIHISFITFHICGKFHNKGLIKNHSQNQIR